ncbi:filamentous hemagglutinin family N-terminal domain-containing protein [Anaerovibrio lipolyticus DSM 3074]|uniref:Filamentous hemagglutinin family N-terminal domain-containing protein n=1 Tax=Anaerovibrio lipolyticus DSM 3074 TaxID=1120997 RepID=A0A1M6FVL9_9FIRM|nr:filamentous hemagglutinin N-terminal domain-containing protein [Anaerovibrio lipolyticus]SHJ01756.1 filamentous hemagglutinin family N-terminal domain-containing protein [Anaerovibrio lipolyticus DSM 3074]
MTNRNLLSKKIILGLATATLCYGPFGVGYAEVGNDALPNIDKVAYGDVTISTTTATEENQAVKSTMDILQTTDKAIIDWNSFNVGRDATVNFIQTLNGKPNVAAMTLNRVNEAGGMSEIAGHINSIGSFILVNPNGTMFYEGSEVNAAGVVISTADIDAEQFKNGKLYFKQDGTKNENIIINGKINASTNGEYMDKMLSDIKNNDALMAKLKENLKNSPLNLDGIQLATGFSVANNTIKLVADGDITVGEKGSLQAVTSTTISGDKTVGTEEFSVEGDSSTRLGSITLRADQNADDVNKDGKAAKVYLNYDYNKDAPQIASHSVGIYYNPDIVSKEATVESLGITGANATNYTQKDYTNYSKEAEAYKSKVAQIFTEFSRSDDKKAVTQTRGIQNQGYHMLVNNLYQMEAIQYSDKANMGGSYAQGTSFQAENTKYWNDGKGFKSIGSTDNVFHGGFTGHGGSNTYSITDLTINRPDEDNVGLFGVAKKASFWSMNLVDSNIIGKNNVGGIAGQATDYSKFSSISVRKSIPANNVISETNNITGNDNVGGIVGEIFNGGTIRFSSNNDQIGGNNKVGGLVGSLSGGAAGGSDEGSSNNIYKSNNSGVINSNGKSAGGLAGYINSSLNTKDNQFATGDNTAKDTTMKSAAVAIIESYSNGSVQGNEDVGGIVGTLENGTIQYTYNTNENAALSSSSVVSEASVGAGTSIYGRVNGTTNVGGIVGNMTGGAIDQSYNAGNIEGSTNVGGVVGSMSGGSITKAYNADNNTVLKTSTNYAEYYGFKVGNDSYTYDHANQTWLKNGSAISPADLKKVDESKRVYNNRLAYRDATVTGTENVGGIVGTMSNGSMDQVYNAGRVKANEDASNVGAFVGKYEAGSVNDSFYVTTENDGTKVTAQDQVVGNKEGSTMEGITAKTLYEAQSPNILKWTSKKDNSDNYKNTGNGWTIYNNSSTPLLNHFMKMD